MNPVLNNNPTFSQKETQEIYLLNNILNASQKQAPPVQTQPTQPTVKEASSVIFSKSNMILIISILVIYAILYSLFRLFLGERYSLGYKGIFIDILAVILVFYWIINYNTTYFSNTKEDPVGGFLVWMRNYCDNISNVFLTVLVVIMFYLIMYVLQVPMDPYDRPYSFVIINGLLWSFLFIQLFNVLCMVLFGFSIADAIFDPFIKGWYGLPGNDGKTPAPTPAQNQVYQDLSGLIHLLKEEHPDYTDITKEAQDQMPSPTPTINVSLPQNYYNCKATAGPSIDDGAEVFNIANNLYTYDDANAICQAFGARLATYDEVEAAYNDGGEWCNYGWSADQMALFPTQKETWRRLQQTASHKNDCGRPGVNGGYMDNPNLKFGVNCYGMKPEYSDKDVSGIKIKSYKSVSNVEQARIDYWKKHMDQLQLNAFNFSNWTEYGLPGQGGGVPPQPAETETTAPSVTPTSAAVENTPTTNVTMAP